MNYFIDKKTMWANQHTLELVKDPQFNEYLRTMVEKMIDKYRAVPYRTPGSIVYEKIKEKVEENYRGKIVAIDLKEAQVVGVGNTIEEAYENALKHSSKKRFYFRKVGTDYLVKV